MRLCHKRKGMCAFILIFTILFSMHIAEPKCTVKRIKNGVSCPREGEIAETGQFVTYACNNDELPNLPDASNAPRPRGVAAPKYQYYLHGSPVLQCRANGLWDKAKPVCQPLSCYVPGWEDYYFGDGTNRKCNMDWASFNDGDLVPGLPDKSPEHANGKCRSPKHLKWNYTFCLGSGRTLPVLFKCNDVRKCESWHNDHCRYPEIPGAEMTISGRRMLSTYKCKSGYEQSKCGENVLSCVTGAKWRELPITCNRVSVTLSDEVQRKKNESSLPTIALVLIVVGVLLVWLAAAGAVCFCCRGRDSSKWHLDDSSAKDEEMSVLLTEGHDVPVQVDAESNRRHKSDDYEVSMVRDPADPDSLDMLKDRSGDMSGQTEVAIFPDGMKSGKSPEVQDSLEGQEEGNRENIPSIDTVGDKPVGVEKKLQSWSDSMTLNSAQMSEENVGLALKGSEDSGSLGTLKDQCQTRADIFPNAVKSGLKPEIQNRTKQQKQGAKLNAVSAGAVGEQAAENVDVAQKSSVVAANEHANAGRKDIRRTVRGRDQPGASTLVVNARKSGQVSAGVKRDRQAPNHSSGKGVGARHAVLGKPVKMSTKARKDIATWQKTGAREDTLNEKRDTENLVAERSTETESEVALPERKSSLTEGKAPLPAREITLSGSHLESHLTERRSTLSESKSPLPERRNTLTERRIPLPTRDVALSEKHLQSHERGSESKTPVPARKSSLTDRKIVSPAKEITLSGSHLESHLSKRRSASTDIKTPFPERSALSGSHLPGAKNTERSILSESKSPLPERRSTLTERRIPLPTRDVTLSGKHLQSHERGSETKTTSAERRSPLTQRKAMVPAKEIALSGSHLESHLTERRSTLTESKTPFAERRGVLSGNHLPGRRNTLTETTTHFPERRGTLTERKIPSPAKQNALSGSHLEGHLTDRRGTLTERTIPSPAREISLSGSHLESHLTESKNPLPVRRSVLSASLLPERRSTVTEIKMPFLAKKSPLPAREITLSGSHLESHLTAKNGPLTERKTPSPAREITLSGSHLESHLTEGRDLLPARRSTLAEAIALKAPFPARGSTLTEAKAPAPARVSTLTEAKAPTPARGSTLTEAQAPTPARGSTLTEAKAPLPIKRSTLLDARAPLPARRSTLSGSHLESHLTEMRGALHGRKTP